MEEEPVAIIGAGIAGLSCAQTLRQAGVPARVFEREGRVGGRCTTRLWQGHLLDDGIPFFTAQSPDFKRELIGRLRQFRPIIAPVFDAQGAIVVSPGGPRFYVLQGNNYFAQMLAQGLEISLREPVENIVIRDDGVEVLGQAFRAVVSSLPPMETARLFGHAETGADFPACISALLEYASLGVGESSAAYGHVTRAGPIAASYCENHKSARIVGPKTVFVAHSSEEFSEQHADEPEENYLPELVRANEEMWKIPPGCCSASFGYRWRMRARPLPTLELPRGAFLCGEGQAAATIEDAWRDGRLAGQEVLAFLGLKAPE
jgi:predicted NAD/FAD-dependent oxidoreductase